MGLATKDSGTGVYGGGSDRAGAPGAGSIGVRGETFSGIGVKGKSFGSGVGVRGESAQNDGVVGVAHVGNKSGVFGFNVADGVGVGGFSNSGIGVRGINEAPATIQPDRECGVHGETINGYGVCGVSENHEGVRAVSVNDVGVTASGGRLAGLFLGDVEVTGDLRLVNADCAEDFDISGTEKAEPGTVMVLDQEGALQVSQQAYDKKVAGVISGAGAYKPAITLDKQQVQGNRMPIALLGKVYCKVDAQYASIEVGDLLTTSPTPGHGMKAVDPLKAFGSVIGKALRPLGAGQGLIPILIALQ
jgi:hypothetical protein